MGWSAVPLRLLSEPSLTCSPETLQQENLVFTSPIQIFSSPFVFFNSQLTQIFLIEKTLEKITEQIL